MRDIKFRAWDVKREHYFDILWFDFENKEDGLPWVHSGSKFITDVILEQFTGLHDKNGKEVYEGDIVRFKCWGHEYIDKVEYHKWGYYPIAPSKPEVSLSADGEIEIIGNIHENNELLE